MEFFEALGTRRSVRAFKTDPVPADVLDRLLEAAREAPSAENKMPWKLVVVEDPGLKAALASEIYGKFMAQAPLLVVGCGDRSAAPSWYQVDTAIALEHLVLAATAEGLGSCWVGSYDKARAKELLGIPPSHEIVAMLALGYPRNRPDVARLAVHLIHPGKTLSTLVAKDRFSEPWPSD